MSSTPTTRNRLTRQATGDNAGSWGEVLNTQDFDLIDEALDGLTTVTVSANVTLTSINFASDQARRRILKLTGTGGFNVTVPGVQKYYLVHNACSAPVTIKTAASAGTTISVGAVIPVYCDGTDFYPSTNIWPLADGTASAPSLYFANNSTCGLYRVGANNIGFSVAGISILRIATTGISVGVSTNNFSSAVGAISVGYTGAGTQYGIVMRPQSDTTRSIDFQNASGTGVGSISQTTTTTTYNTSSDYRLKDNIIDLIDSGPFIDALRPREWLWRETGERGVGFVAHEVQAVSPSSVHGDRDAVDVRGRPIYQGMQAGSPEIIAHLVAEVQALRARVADLEAR